MIKLNFLNDEHLSSLKTWEDGHHLWIGSCEYCATGEGFTLYAYAGAFKEQVDREIRKRVDPYFILGLNIENWFDMTPERQQYFRYKLPMDLLINISKLELVEYYSELHFNGS